MLLLGIETSTRRVGVVLASGQGMLARVELGGHADTGPPRHAEQLVPAIEYCCAQLDVTLDRVSAVAVGVGPGMFTGLRVGVTTVKTLAQVLRVPMIPVPSLDLLAYPLRHSKALLVPAIDAVAQRALLRAVPRGARRGAARAVGVRGGPRPRISSPSWRRAARRRCSAATARCATRPSSARSSSAELAGPAHVAPSLAALSGAGESRGIEREEFCSPDDVLPLYLRKSDAELAVDAKDR